MQRLFNDQKVIGLMYFKFIIEASVEFPMKSIGIQLHYQVIIAWFIYVIDNEGKLIALFDMMLYCLWCDIVY